MKTALLKKLCCPIDKSDLHIRIITVDKTGDEDEILEGLMTCPECHRYYPIIYGIPIMSPDEYREFGMEKPVLERWEKQLDEKLVADSSFKLLPEAKDES